jgi:GT2 family glycosyltransferase
MKKPRVAIIYLCYNNLRHLDEVVKGLAKQSFSKDQTRVYMVPNGSPDGIAEEIRRNVLPRSGKDLPEIQLIDDGVNRGFAGGNNHATQLALDEGFDYIFLQNGDLRTDAEMLGRLVGAMEEDESIGSAQPLVLFWHEEDKVNVSGGVLHVAGYGYARDNGKMLSKISYKKVEEVTYVTGAAAMYRAQVLKKVGTLEEAFFMYHEDLELGLRIRLAGWKNVLVSQARAYHDYSFSRNPKKFQWTELYRYIVLLASLRVTSLIVLLPILIPVELATWIFALKGGWFKAKLWAFLQWFRFSTWKTLWRMKIRAMSLRRISDKELLKFMTPQIADQEQMSAVIDRIANPGMAWVWKRLSKLVK